MIRDDRQLALAQRGVRSLQRVLQEARKVHSPEQYRLMSEPILMELQDRERDILLYLSAPARA